MAAVLHQDRDLLDLAIHHYESALQLEPDRSDVLRNLGLAFTAKGELDQARTTYERAFALSPGDPVLLRNMGELRDRLRDPEGRRGLVSGGAAARRLSGERVLGARNGAAGTRT